MQNYIDYTTLHMDVGSATVTNHLVLKQNSKEIFDPTSRVKNHFIL